MNHLTFSEIELHALTGEADETFHMDQETFSALYERTARPLWVFLWRRSGDRQIADDLLQETYYRFLKARGPFDSDDHRKNYLFRIAANLVNDAHRNHHEHVPLRDEHKTSGPGDQTLSTSLFQKNRSKLFGKCFPCLVFKVEDFLGS